jgi:hypothetical protein
MVMLKDRNTKECKTNCSTYTERNEEIGRPRNRWKDKVKEGFSVMGIINNQAMARESREWRKFLWEAKVHNGMYLMRRRRRRRRGRRQEVETMRYKVYIAYMYRHMQNHTDILKILFFLPKLSCTLLERIKCQTIVL